MRTWLQKLKQRVGSAAPTRRTRFRGVARVDAVEDPAVHLDRGRLVVIHGGNKPKWLRFTCPCRCGQVLALNLMESHMPRWTLHWDERGRLTVSPSVDSLSCGAHFFIRANGVVWC